MIKTFGKQVLSTMLSLLVIAAAAFDAGAQQAGQQGAPGNSGQGAPLSAEELQQLVAPIALYPDALVAQVLGASTFPDQIVSANNFLQQNTDLTGSVLMRAVDSLPWDPSVKGLTQFPSVLANLAKNLSWTSSLGEAYHTQTADVMTAVQALRWKAIAAGNLISSSQITVVQQSPQVVVIQPANPQVVYVPVYNPAVVYGYPYVTPAYVAPPVAATAVVAFGVGIAVGAMMSGGCCAWGYSSWNCGWHGTTAVVYHGGAYYGNNAWHGGYYGSSASAYGAYGSAHYSSGYNPSTGTYAHGAPSRTVTAAPALVQLTTQGPGPLPRQCKGPMRMAATGPRRLRKTAPPLTASTKATLTEPPVRCTARAVARLMARRASTATAPLWVRPPMATSTRQPMAKPPAIPAAVGILTRSRAAPATRIVPRNPAHQVGEGKKRAAGHLLSAAEAEAGNPGRRVREAHTAAVVAVIAAKASGAVRTKSSLVIG